MDIYYQNCRGLRSKLFDLKLNILQCNYDLICLTETNFNESVNNNEFIDERYYIVRKDRNLNITDKVDGGGIAIMLKKSIIFSVLDGIDDIYDNIWIRVRTSDGKFIVLCLVYFPPNSTKFEHYEKFCNKLSNLMLETPVGCQFLILGDFNLPGITWSSNCDVTYPVFSHGRCANHLLETMIFNELIQHNHVKNSLNRVLDLVLSNLDFKTIMVNRCMYPLTKIDLYHPPLLIRVDICLLKSMRYKQLNSPNLKLLDYPAILCELESLDWNNTFLNCNVEQAIDKFYEILYGFMKPKNRSGDHLKFPIWYSNKLIKLIRLKETYHKRHRKFKNSNDYVIFSNLRKNVKYEIRKCSSNYLKYVERHIKQNPKLIWSYTQSLTTRAIYPSCMKLGAIEANDICNLFADHFESIYVDESFADSSNFHVNSQSVDLVSEEDVSKVISSLDIKKGAGSDNLTNFLIFKLKPQLIKPLTLLFNLSLKMGVFPSHWKKAFLVPIYKKSDASNVINYRPISILNSFSKIFEKIVYCIIFNDVKHLINPSQHGFFPKRSTTTNLIDMSNFIFTNVDKGGQVDCIYTDFEKAFDTVSHRILIRKCADMGLSGQILNWLKSYLSGRKQQVKFNGFLSRTIVAKSGVPQGSTLGPLLFLIFINDLPTVLSTRYLLYADDLKIFTGVNDASDCFRLQSDLQNLSVWSKANKLRLNINKCVAISYTRKANHISFPYNINDIVLVRVHEITDLGVVFDSKLKFDLHIAAVCAKAHKLLGFIFRRGKEFRDPNVFITLYKSLVRSCLEYCSQIWCPYYESYKTQIERVQRKFTIFLMYKCMPFSRRVNYKVRLKIYKLQSLENRRLILDEIFLYKLINNSCEAFSLSCLNFYAPFHRVRSAMLFFPSFSRTNLGFANPLYRLQSNHNEFFLDCDLFLLSLYQFRSAVNKTIELLST